MEPTASDIEWLTTASDAVLGVMSDVIDTITTTPVLAIVFVAGTIIPLGIGLFKKFRR